METTGVAADTAALVEREAELGALEGLMDAALSGAGGTAVLEGAAGMGKSFLLARAAEASARRGLRVLSARADPLERDFPARTLVAAGDEKVEVLREAVDVLSGSVAELEHARALTDLGAALRGRGDQTTAREPLRLALAEADRLGATALAARAREELVASGLRPRRAPISGVAALTPRQRRVCELAAAGRTNRDLAQELFVTVKTIETHLLAAYHKLGISSKSELASALGAGQPAP